MKKMLLAGAVLMGSFASANAQQLVDPCGSPKEFYSKYLLDKCYKVYFDAITDAKKKAEEADKKATQALDMVKKLEGKGPGLGDLPDRVGKLERIADDHEKRIRALEGRPRIEGVGPYKWQLEEIGSIKFDFNRFTIRRDQVKSLEDIARRAKESDKEILVVGFADKVGSSRYNFNLSMWRAQNTASELAKRGVDIGKIRMASYGKEIADLLDPKDRQNQRVVKVYIIH